MNDNASLSRATSISRASKQGSTVSRNQSLIRKNIAPQDLKPSDVLIERFIAWKVIVKQLIAYFEVRLSSRLFCRFPLICFSRALPTSRTTPQKNWLDLEVSSKSPSSLETNSLAKEVYRYTIRFHPPPCIFDSGMQDIYYGIRDKTRVIADQHANLGRTVNGSIVQHLHRVRTEIKAHVKV